MHIFFAPNIANTLELPEEESLHCTKVLRLTEGVEILIADGKGRFHKARIARAHHKRCGVELLATFEDDSCREYGVHIAIAPTKNLDRMEWFAEKATEIGIDSITFIRSRYSERKELKLERIQKILVSAMKQSMKATVPEMDTMIEFVELMNRPFNGKKYIAHCHENDERRLFSKEQLAGENVLVLIGPEGDFSQEEVDLAIKSGFEPISLGKSRLRTETAALVACHTIHLLNNL
jgi:16S rRNA (uracil1498-N3)-methyltransferase